MVILEAGHGGMIDGEYQCLAKGKRYEFVNPPPLEIFEGVTNRQIAGRLARKLKVYGIPFHDLNIYDNTDMPLATRVKKINEIYTTDKKAWLLSIHSNAMGSELKGTGYPARGCEIYIAQNAGKKSQQIHLIAEKHYKLDRHLPWRGAKTANFYILRETKCPALLVENYFFTNRKDAEYLLSEKGQEEIADTLFRIVQEVGTIFAS